jgi:hypothetical protein
MSSSNLRTAALVQFYQFHKLPFELRQLIGQFSLPERCYVQVFGPCWQLACSPSCTLCRRPQDDSWRLERERRFPISSEEDPRKKRTRYEEQVGPESLRTCRKSREETLRHYIPLFKDGSKLRTIYFSPARDVVDIGNGRLEDLHKFLFAAGDFSTEMQEQLNLVKRVSMAAVKWRSWKNPLFNHGFWDVFKGVEELIFSEYDSEEWGARYFQHRLDYFRDTLARVHNSSMACKIPVKTISLLTYDHIIHK